MKSFSNLLVTISLGFALSGVDTLLALCDMKKYNEMGLNYHSVVNFWTFMIQGFAIAILFMAIVFVAKRILKKAASKVAEAEKSPVKAN